MRPSFEDALRHNTSTNAGADSALISLTPANSFSTISQTEELRPALQRVPSAIVAAALVPPPTDAASGQLPHAPEPANAAPSPWRRVTPDPAPTRDEDAAALDARIRAAIESASASSPPEDGNTPILSKDVPPLDTPARGPTSAVAVPVAEIWTASPGDFLTVTLESWAARAGWTVQNQSGALWTIRVPVSIEGGFEEAVNELVLGFQQSSPNPEVTSYPNKVMIIRKGGQRAGAQKVGEHAG